MRFLIDQDVYAATTRFLKSLGHYAVTASELGLAKASDETLLKIAAEQKRILVTRDRDYGALVFLKLIGAGVLYLRVLPSTQDAVHAELAKVLGQYSEHELAAAFVVIEPAGHRIRRLQGSVPNANTPPPSS
jgi:predicted nuclease of predicted toxin-antitoxin system